MPTAVSTIVGALACQRNSFLKSLQTVVTACREHTPQSTSKDKQNVNKKKTGVPADNAATDPHGKFEVELEDTILFPEGGGQPYDTGAIILPDNSEVQVMRVVRNKLTALHITDEKIDVGTQVTLKLNWDRRIDLMQQHTGQHLLSAVLDTYDLETLSWSMGDTINYIELPRKVDESIVGEVNTKVNDLILRNVSIKVTTPDDHGGELDISHIPDDYDTSKGIIRVVNIGDMDANPCCGTHLQTTSQIQAISLLHQQNVRGGNSRLFFICGARVYKYLNKQHKILKTIQGNYLSCQLDEVIDKVGLLSTNLKQSTTRESNLLKELAVIEAEKIFKQFETGQRKVVYVYRADPNPEYLQTFQKSFTTLVNTHKDSGVNISDKYTLILINGDYKSGLGGMVKVLGPAAESLQGILKEKLTNLKGGGKGSSFQAKVTKYEKGELESLFKYLDELE